jgi:hypothetical protein
MGVLALGRPPAGTAASLAVPRCDLTRSKRMGRVHHRTWLAGNDRSILAVWTARVGGQVAGLDALEAAACALVVLAQADVFEFAAQASAVEHLFY